MTNPNCRVLIFSILRFISTKCCKTQSYKVPQNINFANQYDYSISLSPCWYIIVDNLMWTQHTILTQIIFAQMR